MANMGYWAFGLTMSLNQLGELLALGFAEMFPYHVVVLQEECICLQSEQVLFDLIFDDGIAGL